MPPVLGLKDCVTFKVMTMGHRGSRHPNKILFASLISGAFSRSLQFPEVKGSNWF